MVHNLFKTVVFHLSKNIVKKYKKYKIWFASIFYYEDHVERFGLIVRILKTEKKNVEHIRPPKMVHFNPSI